VPTPPASAGDGRALAAVRAAGDAAGARRRSKKLKSPDALALSDWSIEASIETLKSPSAEKNPPLRGLPPPPPSGADAAAAAAAAAAARAASLAAAASISRSSEATEKCSAKPLALPFREDWVSRFSSGGASKASARALASSSWQSVSPG
jgi:hypothetical protein